MSTSDDYALLGSVFPEVPRIFQARIVNGEKMFHFKICNAKNESNLDAIFQIKPKT